MATEASSRKQTTKSETAGLSRSAPETADLGFSSILNFFQEILNHPVDLDLQPGDLNFDENPGDSRIIREGWQPW